MPSVFPEPPPGSIHAEYILSDQLRIAEIPGEVLAMQVRPQNPQVLLPPRLGYNDRELTIGDVLDISRWKPVRRAFVSGAAAIPRTPPTKPTPGDRTVWTEDSWSGSSRNSLGTV